MSTSYELQAPKFGPYVYAQEANSIVRKGFTFWALNLMGLRASEKGRD